MKSPDVQRIKCAIKWLIGQGYGSNQEEIGVLLGYKNKSSFSQTVNDPDKRPADFVDRLTSIDKNLNKVWIETGFENMIISKNDIESDKISDINNNSTEFEGENIDTIFTNPQNEEAMQKSIAERLLSVLENRDSSDREQQRNEAAIRKIEAERQRLEAEKSLLLTRQNGELIALISKIIPPGFSSDIDDLDARLKKTGSE